MYVAYRKIRLYAIVVKYNTYSCFGQSYFSPLRWLRAYVNKQTNKYNKENNGCNGNAAGTTSNKRDKYNDGSRKKKKERQQEIGRAMEILSHWCDRLPAHA